MSCSASGTVSARRRATPRICLKRERRKSLKRWARSAPRVIIGAMKDSREETIYEISDLCYHVLVLMVSMGITVEDIKNELKSPACNRPQGKAGDHEVTGYAYICIKMSR